MIGRPKTREVQRDAVQYTDELKEHAFRVSNAAGHTKQPNLRLASVFQYRLNKRSSIIGQRAQLSSATWNWQHRDDAGDGESGGKDVHCGGVKHDSRAAAPNHRHSSYSYTYPVERSDERLNMTISIRHRVTHNNLFSIFFRSHSHIHHVHMFVVHSS